MNNLNIIKHNIEDSIALKTTILSNESILVKIELLANIIIECFQKKGKVLFCGNGGSAADAQHLASELSGKYYYDRPPLHSEALHVNASYITAVANDYTYDQVYSRLIQAIGNKKDIIIGLSTSGNSPNIIQALKTAKSKKITTVGFTGKGGGKMSKYCDILLTIPSTDTPRIQECHMLLGHAVCQIVEMRLFPQ